MGRSTMWTKERAEEAHALYETGLSLKETAAQYGGSGPNLGASFRRLGLSIRPSAVPDHRGQGPREKAVRADHSCVTVGGECLLCGKMVAL